MLQISNRLERALETSEGIGFYNEFGAVIGDAEFVLYYNIRGEPFLAHISEFEVDGVMIKLKEISNE